MRKRSLLSALALGCTFVATPALADLPQLRLQAGGVDISLTAGASVQGAAIDDNDRARSKTDGQYDLFARINAEWVSPSGIVIGANLEANNRDRETESLETGEIYGFAASDYGRLEVGLQDGAADMLGMAAPVIALGQIRGDFSRYAGSIALLRTLDTQDSFKVLYLSPPVKGFRAGASWSPKFTQNADAVNPRSRVIVYDAVELGLQFQQPVGEWVLGASGGYAFGNADPITQRADLSSWSVGAQARRGQLRIGGAYVRRGESNRLERDFNQWEVNGGVAWVEDRWGVSASSSLTKSSERRNRLFAIGGFYSLTRNIQIRSDVVQFREQRTGRIAENGLVGILELQIMI